MATTFAASLQQFADKTKEQMKAVLSASVQDVLEEAEKPTAQGGKMPVRTGFLRNSLVSELNGTTQWPVTFPPKKGEPSGNRSPTIALTIEGMQPGDIARFAWTAVYAQRLHEGFVGMDEAQREYDQAGLFWIDNAAAQWPAIVAKNIARLK